MEQRTTEDEVRASLPPDTLEKWDKVTPQQKEMEVLMYRPHPLVSAGLVDCLFAP